MNSRTHTKHHIHYIGARPDEMHCFNIPIECIRKTRSLNIDRHTLCVSREIYKILKSSNGQKLFA